MGLAILSEVHARDRAQLDAQGLKEDGKDVGHEYNEQELELVGSAGCHIGRIIARVDVCNCDHEARPDKLCIFEQDLRELA